MGAKFDSYIRVSRVMGREAQEDGTGYQSDEDQRRRIAATAIRYGVKLSGVEAVEEDVSGKLRAEDRGLDDLIVRVERGQSAGIIVADLDLLHRPKQKDEAELWDRMQAAKGRLLTGDGIDTDAPGGELLYRIKGGIAHEQWKQKRDAWARAMERQIAAGHHHTGTIPLGYRRDEHGRLEPDPATKDIAVEVFRKRASGMSCAKIARWLADQGLTPRSESGVQGMLVNTVYAGTARYGSLTKANAHEAIVPKSVWRKVQDKRQRPSARTGRLTRRFLLQGLAVCGSCGRPMYLGGGTRPGDHEHYICRRVECDQRAYTSAKALDAFVLNRVEELLTGWDSDGEFRVGEGDRERYEAALYVPLAGEDGNVEELAVALEEARADLDAYLSNTKLLRQIGEEKYNARVSDYVAVLNKTEADLAEARERSTGSWTTVSRLWNSEWGWAERKEWVERVVGSVVVQRSNPRGQPLSQRCEVELRYIGPGGPLPSPRISAVARRR